MKAVIVEAEGKYAVALNKSGEFVKIKDTKNYSVGYEVDIPAAVHYSSQMFTKAASLAAAFLLLVSLGLAGFSYASPYSYIDVDINPSVEITSNIFNRIIEIKAFNKEGEKIIAFGNYKNKSIDEGIASLLKSAVDNGYLKTSSISNNTPEEKTNNTVMLTVSCKNTNDGEKIKKSIRSIAISDLKAEKIKSHIISESTSIQAHNNAKKMGISSGKLKLIEKLGEKDATVKAEDYKNSPVKDIIKAIDKVEKKEVKAGKSKNSKGYKGKAIKQKDNNGTGNTEDKNQGKDKNNSVNTNKNNIKSDDKQQNNNNDKQQSNNKKSKTGKSITKNPQWENWKEKFTENSKKPTDNIFMGRDNKAAKSKDDTKGNKEVKEKETKSSESTKKEEWFQM